MNHRTLLKASEFASAKLAYGYVETRACRPKTSALFSRAADRLTPAKSRTAGAAVTSREQPASSSPVSSLPQMRARTPPRFRSRENIVTRSTSRFNPRSPSANVSRMAIANAQSVSGNPSPAENVLLMFSGGRDSTLAALRLSREHSLTLVTVTSNHLIGIERVRSRLSELATQLPRDTAWIRVSQPEVASASALLETSCLPCHSAYALVGCQIAQAAGVKNVALGYAGYQSNWPEQTPEATRRLRTVLDRHGFNLLLPVYDIADKTSAEHELAAAGLTASAMEQKCLLQHLHEDIPKLSEELERWESVIDAALDGDLLGAPQVLETSTLGDIAQ